MRPCAGGFGCADGVKPELPFSCPELPGVLPELPGATPAAGGGGVMTVGGGGGATNTGGVSASGFAIVADAAGNSGNAGKPSFDTAAGTTLLASRTLGASSGATAGLDHCPHANTESCSEARAWSGAAARVRTTEASATRVFTLVCELLAS